MHIGDAVTQRTRNGSIKHFALKRNKQKQDRMSPHVLGYQQMGPEPRVRESASGHEFSSQRSVEYQHNYKELKDNNHCFSAYKLLMALKHVITTSGSNHRAVGHVNGVLFINDSLQQ